MADKAVTPTATVAATPASSSKTPIVRAKVLCVGTMQDVETRLSSTLDKLQLGKNDIIGITTEQCVRGKAAMVLIVITYVGLS